MSCLVNCPEVSASLTSCLTSALPFPCFPGCLPKYLCLTLISSSGAQPGVREGRGRGRRGTLTQKAEFQEINKGQCSSPRGRREPGEGMVWRGPPAGSLDPGRETELTQGLCKGQKRGNKHPDFSLLPPSDLLVVPPIDQIQPEVRGQESLLVVRLPGTEQQ